MLDHTKKLLELEECLFTNYRFTNYRYGANRSRREIDATNVEYLIEYLNDKLLNSTGPAFWQVEFKPSKDITAAVTYLSRVFSGTIWQIIWNFIPALRTASGLVVYLELPEVWLSTILVLVFILF